jgi:fucose 4-O-acetylase-like acetyltransferase
MAPTATQACPAMTGSTDGRLLWVDVAKTIGIFLIVFSHADQNGYTESFLWTFHVPLFFFVSGYLMRDQPPDEFLRGVGRKLLLPYVYSYILITLISLPLRPGADLEWLGRTLAGIVYGTHSYPYFVNDALWFLPSLITVEILYVFCMRRLALSYLVFLAASYALFRQHYLDLFLSIDLSLLGLNYFLAGTLARRLDVLRPLEDSRPRLAAVAVVCCSITAAAASAGNVWYAGEHYGVALGAGLAGILMVVSVSMLLAPLLARQARARAVVTFVSSNTLFIYCFHALSSPAAAALLAPVALGPPLTRGAVTAALSILLLVPFLLIVRRFLPELIGLRRHAPLRRTV